MGCAAKEKPQVDPGRSLIVYCAFIYTLSMLSLYFALIPTVLYSFGAFFVAVKQRPTFGISA